MVARSSVGGRFWIQMGFMRSFFGVWKCFCILSLVVVIKIYAHVKTPSNGIYKGLLKSIIKRLTAQFKNWQNTWTPISQKFLWVASKQWKCKLKPCIYFIHNTRMGKIERADNTKCFHLFGELEHPYIGAERTNGSAVWNIGRFLRHSV